MADAKKIRVGVNGFGVIGKRVAAAVARQEDMSLAGVSDVVTDWHASAALRNDFRLFGATGEHASGMRAAGTGGHRDTGRPPWPRPTSLWTARPSVSPRRTSMSIAAAA